MVVNREHGKLKKADALVFLYIVQRLCSKTNARKLKAFGTSFATKCKNALNALAVKVYLKATFLFFCGIGDREN